MKNIRVVELDGNVRIYENAEYFVAVNRTLIIWRAEQEQPEMPKHINSIATYNKDQWKFAEVVKEEQAQEQVQSDPSL